MAALRYGIKIFRMVSKPNFFEPYSIPPSTSSGWSSSSMSSSCITCSQAALFCIKTSCLTTKKKYSIKSKANNILYKSLCKWICNIYSFLKNIAIDLENFCNKYPFREKDNRNLFLNRLRNVNITDINTVQDITPLTPEKTIVGDKETDNNLSKEISSNIKRKSDAGLKSTLNNENNNNNNKTIDMTSTFNGSFHYDLNKKEKKSNDVISNTNEEVHKNWAKMVVTNLYTSKQNNNNNKENYYCRLNGDKNEITPLKTKITSIPVSDDVNIVSSFKTLNTFKNTDLNIKKLVLSDYKREILTYRNISVAEKITMLVVSCGSEVDMASREQFNETYINNNHILSDYHEYNYCILKRATTIPLMKNQNELLISKSNALCNTLLKLVDYPYLLIGNVKNKLISDVVYIAKLIDGDDKMINALNKLMKIIVKNAFILLNKNDALEKTEKSIGLLEIKNRNNISNEDEEHVSCIEYMKSLQSDRVIKTCTKNVKDLNYNTTLCINELKNKQLKVEKISKPIIEEKTAVEVKSNNLELNKTVQDKTINNSGMDNSVPIVTKYLKSGEIRKPQNEVIVYRNLSEGNKSVNIFAKFYTTFSDTLMTNVAEKHNSITLAEKHNSITLPSESLKISLPCQDRNDLEKIKLNKTQNVINNIIFENEIYKKTVKDVTDKMIELIKYSTIEKNSNVFTTKSTQILKHLLMCKGKLENTLTEKSLPLTSLKRDSYEISSEKKGKISSASLPQQSREYNFDRITKNKNKIKQEDESYNKECIKNENHELKVNSIVQNFELISKQISRNSMKNNNCQPEPFVNNSKNIENIKDIEIIKLINQGQIKITKKAVPENKIHIGVDTTQISKKPSTTSGIYKKKINNIKRSDLKMNNDNNSNDLSKLNSIKVVQINKQPINKTNKLETDIKKIDCNRKAKTKITVKSNSKVQRADSQYKLNEQSKSNKNTEQPVNETNKLETDIKKINCNEKEVSEITVKSNSNVQRAESEFRLNEQSKSNNNTEYENKQEENFYSIELKHNKITPIVEKIQNRPIRKIKKNIEKNLFSKSTGKVNIMIRGTGLYKKDHLSKIALDKTLNRSPSNKFNKKNTISKSCDHQIKGIYMRTDANNINKLNKNNANDITSIINKNTGYFNFKTSKFNKNINKSQGILKNLSDLKVKHKIENSEIRERNFFKEIRNISKNCDEFYKKKYYVKNDLDNLLGNKMKNETITKTNKTINTDKSKEKKKSDLVNNFVNKEYKRQKINDGNPIQGRKTLALKEFIKVNRENIFKDSAESFKAINFYQDKYKKTYKELTIKTKPRNQKTSYKNQGKEQLKITKTITKGKMIEKGNKKNKDTERDQDKKQTVKMGSVDPISCNNRKGSGVKLTERAVYEFPSQGNLINSTYKTNNSTAINIDENIFLDNFRLYNYKKSIDLPSNYKRMNQTNKKNHERQLYQSKNSNHLMYFYNKHIMKDKKVHKKSVNKDMKPESQVRKQMSDSRLIKIKSNTSANKNKKNKNMYMKKDIRNNKFNVTKQHRSGPSITSNILIQPKILPTNSLNSTNLTRASKSMTRFYKNKFDSGRKIEPQKPNSLINLLKKSIKNNVYNYSKKCITNYNNVEITEKKYKRDFNNNIKNFKRDIKYSSGH